VNLQGAARTNEGHAPNRARGPEPAA